MLEFPENVNGVMMKAATHVAIIEKTVLVALITVDPPENLVDVGFQPIRINKNFYLFVH